MAGAVAEGARSASAEVDIRRVPETAPPAVVEAAHFKSDSAHPVIEGPDALASYDALVIGARPALAACRARWPAFLM
jgi:NAD(P)H dehydrogenase (quinone)